MTYNYIRSSSSGPTVKFYNMTSFLPRINYNSNVYIKDANIILISEIPKY